MSTVDICETFTSIQGESTYAGALCFFIRLAECNLRCSYCDTQHSYDPGTLRQIGDLVKEAGESGAAIVEITGGEPLLQPAFAELATSLKDLSGKTVLIETNGSRDISVVPDGIVTILDVKCPGSNESARMDFGNLERLRTCDEVKFVLVDRADYEWSRELVLQHDLAGRCAAVLFSPVPGRLDASLLAGWIMDDELPVRLQVQLHKLLGLK
jgi:7-carboxy-7-deazaguanine synthase